MILVVALKSEHKISKTADLRRSQDSSPTSLWTTLMVPQLNERDRQRQDYPATYRYTSLPRSQNHSSDKLRISLCCLNASTTIETFQLQMNGTYPRDVASFPYYSCICMKKPLMGIKVTICSNANRHHQAHSLHTRR